MIFLFTLLVGLGLLFFGRKLFWLFVGGLGFVAGLYIASIYLTDQPEWMTLLIALGAGVLGAVLAVVVQKFAIGVAGFFAGGFFLAHLAETFEWQTGQFHWLLFISGGIGGAILAALLFEWALILLSSLTGSYLIVNGLHVKRMSALLILIPLSIVGVIVQARAKKSKKKSNEQK